MGTKDKKLIIFDLDGTLVDTLPDLAHCINLVMCELDLPEQEQQKVRKYIGNGIHRLMQDILSTELSVDPDEALVTRAFNSFIRHYQQHFTSESSLYPNAAVVLKRLKSNNIKLACITNKLEAFTLPLLKHFQIDNYFDLILSGDSLKKKKPDAFPLVFACTKLGVKVTDSVMVGDSENDMMAAKSAGMTSICVSYGYTNIGDIDKLSSDYVSDSFLQLLDFIVDLN